MAVHAPNHDDLLVDWDFLLSLYLLTHTASTATIHSFVFFFFRQPTCNDKPFTRRALEITHLSKLEALRHEKDGDRRKDARNLDAHFPLSDYPNLLFFWGSLFFSVRLTARKTNKPTTLPFKTTVPETQSKARLP